LGGNHNSLTMAEYLIVVPLQGLHLTDSDPLLPSIFDRSWSFVGWRQFSDLESLHGAASSLSSNVQMIRERLAPDSLLLYRCDSGVEAEAMFRAYDDADSIVAAVCMASLLRDNVEDPFRIIEPRPLFRARFREHCDLPLAFTGSRVLMAGHHGGLSWMSIGRHPTTVWWTAQEIDAVATAGPRVLGVVLTMRADATPIQAELIASMRALAMAFQATSIGQFVAAAVAAVENLVGADERWNVKADRLARLVGTAYRVRVEEVLNARHEFVHGARQPAATHGS
jgi:hypothetical protein